MTDSIVFVSDRGHLNSTISGGVQVCTREYIELLKAAQFKVEAFAVPHTKRLSTRMKIKFGVEVYERYDFDTLFRPLSELVDRTQAHFVALNQVALAGFAPLLKRRYGDRLSVLLLSHGNESGDFLHEVIRASRKQSLWVRFRDICRLGFLIASESDNYTHHADLVLCLSETEMHINKWLGARRGLFIPRTFNPADINWSPKLNRVGFVGSLNHKPNYDGLVSVLEAIESLGAAGVRVRLVGGPTEIGQALQARYGIVDYVGSIPDDELRTEAASWSMFLNPVFWYSRGASTKLATGINWGIPIVSTRAGNRGYVWTEGSLITVDTPLQMAAAVLSATRDMGKIQSLSSAVKKIAQSGPTRLQLAAELRHCVENQCN